MPMRTDGAGSPRPTNPTTTGNVAASKPVTGATTPIRPRASPWYKPTMPATAQIPAIAARRSVVEPGNDSWVASATGTMTTAPTRSTTIAMAKTDARRPVQPPPKSPAPQLTAEARPNATTARSDAAGSAVGSAGCDRLASSVVHFHRAVEDDDRVGRRIIAIAGGQVDHLEVRGELTQELERPRRAAVVQGDERVVEDERRAAIAGHEPNEAEPGGKVDEVQRSLAEGANVDPIAFLRSEQ